MRATALQQKELNHGLLRIAADFYEENDAVRFVFQISVFAMKFSTVFTGMGL